MVDIAKDNKTHISLILLYKKLDSYIVFVLLAILVELYFIKVKSFLFFV